MDALLESPPVSIPAPQELMLNFVSLGDNCEFGLVQRHNGAEPLDLFRFSYIPFEQLIRALETDLAHVGKLENVRGYGRLINSQ